MDKVNFNNSLEQIRICHVIHVNCQFVFTVFFIDQIDNLKINR